MPNTTTSEKGRIERLLGVIERVGNKLPDPAILFFISLIIVWVLSAVLLTVQFDGIVLVMT